LPSGHGPILPGHENRAVNQPLTKAADL
jgi:hypothetical protein